MNETIHAGAYVRIFDDDGTLIGRGVFMGKGPVNIDVPNIPLMSGVSVPRFEMDSGYTLYGDYETAPAGAAKLH